jgi:hypothetical protein
MQQMPDYLPDSIRYEQRACMAAVVRVDNRGPMEPRRPTCAAHAPAERSRGVGCAGVNCVMPEEGTRLKRGGGQRESVALARPVTH